MFRNLIKFSSLISLPLLAACAVETDEPPQEIGDVETKVQPLASRTAPVQGVRMRLIAKSKDAAKRMKKRALGKAAKNDRVARVLERRSGVKLVQAYPHSRLPELQQVYEVTCTDCDAGGFESELRATGEFTEVQQLEQPVMLGHGNPDGYDPKDWMWYAHAQDWMWHLVQTKADLAWNMTTGDPGVTIAVVDAGFDPSHPELLGKLNTEDPRTERTLSVHSHGTATAAMAAGETAHPDGTAQGMMPSAGFDSSVQALMWGGTAGAHHAALAMDADVVNISWFSGCSPDPTGIDQLAIKEILDAGTSIVVAAANGPEHCGGGPTYPFNADYDERIIVVTSTGKDDAHRDPTDTHSHYAAVDLAAPGYGVMIANQDSSWNYFGSAYGTSFAAPQVAAAAALMKSVNSCLQPDDVQRILKNSTDPITDARDPEFEGLVGTGRLNTNRAVALAHAERCPAGGSYDGANCYLGKPPEGTRAFIWGGNYYHTPLPGNECPLEDSWYDGANCYLQEVPEGVNPFIYDNKWYYSDCSSDGWTEWKDIDNPSGSGDYEHLNAFPDVCEVPLAIQCRTKDGTYYTQTSDEVVSCDRKKGLSCRNTNQADGRCEDYEVRFFCPEPPVAPPATPTAFEPGDGDWVPFSSQSSYEAELSFQSVEGADSYEVRLFVDSPSGTPVETQTVESNEAYIYVNLPVQLHKDYYWQVRAVNSGGASDWSPAWHFFPALIQ